MVSISAKSTLCLYVEADDPPLADPIREELLASSSISVLLGLLDSRVNSTRTVKPVYSVGSWAGDQVGDIEKWKTKLDTSSTVATWAMNILEDILAGGERARNSAPLLVLTHLVP